MRTRNIKIGMEVFLKNLYVYEVIQLDYRGNTCKVLISNYLGQQWVWPRQIQPAKVQP